MTRMRAYRLLEEIMTSRGWFCVDTMRSADSWFQLTVHKNGFAVPIMIRENGQSQDMAVSDGTIIPFKRMVSVGCVCVLIMLDESRIFWRTLSDAGDVNWLIKATRGSIEDDFKEVYSIEQVCDIIGVVYNELGGYHATKKGFESEDDL